MRVVRSDTRPFLSAVICSKAPESGSAAKLPFAEGLAALPSLARPLAGEAVAVNLPFSADSQVRKRFRHALSMPEQVDNCLYQGTLPAEVRYRLPAFLRSVRGPRTERLFWNRVDVRDLKLGLPHHDAFLAVDLSF